MRQLLNTLYVTTPDSRLCKEGENVVVKVGEEERLRVPVRNLEGIVYFGWFGIAPSLLGMLSEHGVKISMMTPSGKFVGRFSGRTTGNVLLRRTQYRMAEGDRSVDVVRNIVSGKIANSAVVLKRTIRDHREAVDVDKLDGVVSELRVVVGKVGTSTTIDTIRGHEGVAAASYYSVFDDLILCQKEHFFMRGRNRRPPTDNVNAMLSFVYSLLMGEVQSALESVGLDPYVGFLHKDRPGRPGLALDLMEEFRPYLADRTVLSMINRRQVGPDGFECGIGGVTMTEETRKVILTEWRNRKEREITHPYTMEKVQVGLLPYVQALLLSRYLRGDLDAYPTYVCP